MSAERLVPDEREVLMQVASAAASASGLDELLERTCEAARAAMGAASLSISRWERERAVMRTLINVGDLGPGEERWPEDETYGLAAHPSVDRLLRTAQPYFNAVDDAGADPRAVALLQSLEQGVRHRRADRGRGRRVGRGVGQHRARLAPVHRP